MRILRSIPLFAVACASAALLACSSSSSPAPTTTGTDSGSDAADTSTTHNDTGTTTDSSSSTDTSSSETSGPTCPTPLAAGYTCPTPTKPAAGTACTQADLQAFYDACFGMNATQMTCQNWHPASADCSTCVNAWVRMDGTVNTAGCYLTIDSTATDCAGADECDNDCTTVACWNDCQDQASLNSCLMSVQGSGGECYTVAHEATLATCKSNTKYAGCQIATDTDVVPFFQGACQFGGNWSMVTGDAGTDSATTDSAAADAADGG